MAIQHVKGEFFGPEHSAQHREFGFHGSAPAGGGMARHDRSPEASATHDSQIMDDYASGGGIHDHPHGHNVVHIEHTTDGREIHHHEHGGHTVHHKHGMVTHHMHDGSPVHAAHGGGFEHDPVGEYVHRPENMMEPEHHRNGGRAGRREGDGDEAEDKKMIKKAFGEHDRELHHGEHTDLHLARGGMAGRQVRLPRGMRPMGERPHSPINTAPRNPNVTSTPTNDMAGGQMPYGVQPSAEPAMAGGDDGGAQLHSGGRARRR